VTNAVLDAIRTRRIARALTAEPIDRTALEAVVASARWAPSAGNRRLHRFVVVQDPATLRVLRMVTLGMFQRPTAIVVVCIDGAAAASYRMRPTAKSLYLDVGTAAQTLLLAAHSVGLGSGLVTSFSQAAVGAILGLPDGWSPELFVCLGHPAPIQPAGMPSRGRITWRSLTRWERFPRRGL